MYNLCTCSTNIYIKLKYCLTNGYTHLYLTMYMFVQNSKKKIRTCNLNITNAIFSISSLPFPSPPLLLRFKSVANPFLWMGGKWESHGTYMGGRRAINRNTTKTKRLQPLNYDCNLLALSHKDSNLIKQNQNLLCYHYTMGQCHLQFTLYNVQFGFCGCKGNAFLRHYQIFRYILFTLQ